MLPLVVPQHIVPEWGFMLPPVVLQHIVPEWGFMLPLKGKINLAVLMTNH